MEKEKFLDALHELKEHYEDTIYEFVEALAAGEECLRDGDNACFARELVSGLKSTLIDIGMLEEGSGSYAAYDEGSMRGGSMRGMRGGSRAEGSTRMQPRSRTTGRFMRSYGEQPEPNMKQAMQEKINRIPDQQTRMDMQRLFDSLQDAM